MGWYRFLPCMGQLDAIAAVTADRIHHAAKSAIGITWPWLTHA
jgi:hypothetical protein